jgi:hypothetical protein
MMRFFVYSKGIKEVIKYRAGKINTSKAWIAGDSCSHFKIHNAVSVDFNKLD